MAWTWNINAIVPGEIELVVFGQITFSGNYTTGGDSAATFNTTPGANTAGWPDNKNYESALHATRAPHLGNLQIDGGYIGVVVPVAGSNTPKLKLINPSTGNELSAGAYPSAISSAIYHTLQLNFRKNL